MTARRQVSLPEELCALSEQKFGRRFGSLEMFLEFVLRELARDDNQALDKAEQAVLEKRLQDLGYL